MIWVCAICGKSNAEMSLSCDWCNRPRNFSKDPIQPQQEMTSLREIKAKLDALDAKLCATGDGLADIGRINADAATMDIDEIKKECSEIRGMISQVFQEVLLLKLVLAPRKKAKGKRR